MKKQICLSVVSGLLVAMPVFADVAEADGMNKDIYPYKPIPTSEIVSKAKYLSEDDKAITNIFELQRRNLSQGRTTNQPWSGPYWPLKQGMVANPYLERTIFSYVHFIPTVDDIEPYGKRRNYVLTNESQLSEKELAKLAPSEKYDILLGNNLDLSNRIWDFINSWKNDMKWDYITSIDMPGEDYEIEKKNYIVANWEGICHGWAPASGVIPKPEKTVVVTLPDGRRMPFYPEDIKGLISLTWANSLVQDNVLSEGLRCKRIMPKRDRFGRFYDNIPEDGKVLPRCADIHPAVMHVALSNVTGNQGRSFVIDKNPKIAVSNQPVVGYKFKYFHPETGADLSFERALTPYDSYRKSDVYAENRNPSTAYVIGVESTITYADWTQIKKPDSKDYLKDKTDELVSLYDLEIDAVGNIIGGQWRGFKNLLDNSSDSGPAMNSNRPDFLWVVPKNFKKYFSPISTLESWDIRSGQPVPKSWTDASIVAHSFKYEMSKHYGNFELCKVKNTNTGEVKEVPCEFKYPRPQPLLQVINQLIEYSANN